MQHDDDDEIVGYLSTIEAKFNDLKLYDDFFLHRPDIGFFKTQKEQNEDSFVMRHGGQEKAAKALHDFIDKGGFSKADLDAFLKYSKS